MEHEIWMLSHTVIKQDMQIVFQNYLHRDSAMVKEQMYYYGVSYVV